MVNKKLVFFYIFLTVGLFIYVNSFFNNFVWEDWGQLASNRAVQSISNIPIFFRSGPYLAVEQYFSSLYYRPLMLTYFAIVSSMFGANPFPFHLFQWILHVSNAFLVFIFLKKIIKSKSAFFVSLIFLVHPINVETVSYISSASNILYFFCGILGLIFLDKSILLSGVLFTLSIFSNETGVLFLCIAPIYSYIFNKKTIPRTILGSISVFLIYLFGRLQIAKIGFGSSGFFPMERLSVFERFLTIPSVIFFYISTFFFPI